MRLRERYQSVTTPPPSVDRASRYERLRRGVWMGVSTLVAFAGTAVLFALYLALRGALTTTPEGYAVMAAAVLAFGYFNNTLFVWGVGRFNLVPPWQFRVEADDGY